MAHIERERDLDRFLTFVDAIVAIAITLLVLPLVDFVAELQHDGSVDHLLDHHGAQLGAFFLSFTVISRLWYAQHLAVRHLVAMNVHVFNTMMLWALTIAFLPFPTALVAIEGHQAVTKLLYIGTSALSMGMLTLLDWIVTRHPDLADGEGRPELSAALRNTLLLVLALAISLAVPETSYYPMLLLTLDGPIGRLQERWRRRVG